MAEQSRFTNQSKKLLLKIVSELTNTEFNFDEPYDDMDENVTILYKVIKKYMAGQIEYTDVEFFCKLYEENEELVKNYIETKDIELSENLELPVANKYKFYYKTQERWWVTLFYYDEFDSYSKDWVQGQVNKIYEDGNWSYSDGHQYDRDIDDSEWDDVFYGDVELIEPKTNENYEFKKTKSVIGKLDKKTLLKLREMIENRLKII
jgi:hypothetical protein